MKKRIFGLALTLCMVMTLLPITARAESVVPSILIGGWGDNVPNITMTTTEGGPDVHAVTDAKGLASMEGANAENYNIKLEYKQGGKPTLYLKNAYIKPVEKSAIVSKGEMPYPLDLVIEGDNKIDAPWQGFEFYNGDVTVSGSGKLTIRCDGAGLCLKGVAAPGSLTLEGANLDINCTNRFAPLFVGGGDITINGGEIELYSKVGNAMDAYEIYKDTYTADGKGEYYLDGYEERGNIIINGGTINAMALKTPLWCEGNITINGGTFTGTGESRAIGIEGNVNITGGTVTLIGRHFTREAIELEGGTFSITGGTVVVTGVKAAFSENAIPNLADHPGYDAVAGVSEYVTSKYNAKLAEEYKYFKLTDGTTVGTGDAGDAGDAETTGPDETTEESNFIETTQATESTNGSADGNEGSDNTVLMIVLAVVLVILGVGAAFVIIRKKTRG